MEEITRWLFLAWGLYFLLPQFITNFILHEHGWTFAYTGYYWLLEIGLTITVLIFFWKFNHPLIQILSQPVLSNSFFSKPN